MDKKHNDLVGDIIRKNHYDYEKDLPGKGEPLSQDYMQMDTFQHFQKIAKDAGFLPPWLKRQKEIAVLLQQAETAHDVEKINRKIKEYNQLCPFKMQKGLVSLSNLEKARSHWT